MTSLCCLRVRPTSLAIAVALAAGPVHGQPVNDGFNPGANLTPEAIAVQPDGRILVGGQFTELAGFTRNRLGRLLPSGQIDFGFNPGANATVRAIAVQPDGRILVGGAFTQVAGFARNGIARFHPNGLVDQSFVTTGGGAVLDIAIQPDGRILVAGTFTTMGGQPRARLARLQPDGSLDQSFNPGANELVYAVAVQPDGRIVVGGGFSVLGGVPRSRLGRLLYDGSVDQSFTADANDAVFALALQADGRIVAGGSFTRLAGQTRSRIARLTTEGGIDAAFTAGADGTVNALAMQPDGRIVAVGAFQALGGASRNRIARLHATGQIDQNFNPGANNIVSAVAVQPDGTLVVSGAFSSIGGQVRARLARITPEGRLDATFASGTNNEVLATAAQADGRLLVGGRFTHVATGAAIVSRLRLARFLSSGVLDSTFTPSADAGVRAIAVQDDGKILVGGEFSTISGTPRTRLARLHANGTVDVSFADPLANGEVYAIAVQEDGRILVAGTFTSSGPHPRMYLARLHTDGTVDATFAPAIDATVRSIVQQPDGRILVGGAFRTVQHQPRERLARLHADGTLDEALDARVEGSVNVVALQRDGKILVGGPTAIAGTPAPGLARLHTDGTHDSSFAPGEGILFTIAVQADGRLTVGGGFTRFGNQARRNLARLLESGESDGTFSASTGNNSAVHAVALDAHGKLAVGGIFSTLGDQPRENIGRVSAFTSATAVLDVRADGSRVDWTRGGSAPELLQVAFELSLDGVTWTPLGKGVRRHDGWRLDGLALPFDVPFQVRGRGRYPGGRNNGSQSVVESVRTAYLQDDPDKDGLPTAWELRFGTDPRGYDRDGDLDGDGITNAEEWERGTHPNGTFVRYLAEGATSDFFQTRLALLNPDVAPASVLLHFLRADGTTARHEVLVEGRHRATVDVGSIADMASAPAFSTVLESDVPVVLDRTMQWDASGYGTHAETALDAPALRWYLAEGATHSGFDLFYLLQNPNPVPADVRVTFLLPQGAPLVRTYTVPPTSRVNIWVDQLAGLEATDVSAVIEVTNGRPIVVERAMYLTRDGQLFRAGHASAGVTAPTTTWLLAEGATGPYFDLFILLANPDPSQTALVDVTYLLPDGSTREKRYPVAPQSRFTIWVDEEEFPGAGKALADTAVSTQVRVFNQVPIVVERAMWWPGSSATWNEAHNSAGATSEGVRWALADGEDGGVNDTETFLLIANVSSHAGAARVTLMFEDGTTASRTFDVAGTSRFNVQVRDAFPEARGRRFGALVESVGDQQGLLVVERAMYSSSGGVRWAAGTNALATRLQ